jgi:hypothetical protein
MSGSVPSFRSGASLVRPSDEMGAQDIIRERNESNSQRVVGNCICVFGESWAASGCAAFGQQALRSAALHLPGRSRQRAFWKNGWPLPRRAELAVEENPRRAPAGGALVSSGQAGRYRTNPTSRAEGRASRSRPRARNAPRSRRAAVAQSVRPEHCYAHQTGVAVEQPSECRSVARGGCRFLLVKPSRSSQI